MSENFLHFIKLLALCIEKQIKIFSSQVDAELKLFEKSKSWSDSGSFLLFAFLTIISEALSL